MSRTGGLARIRLHGNPGTAEGRRLGGIRSLASHRKKLDGFVLLRHVQFPRQSVALAELLGILAGDGHVGVYQVTVTTNSLTDKEHAKYVKSLLEGLFKVPASILFKKGKNACVVVVSSKEVCRFLVKQGLVAGHKIRGRLAMPEWIKAKKTYRTAFVRGLFDTDGCVYVDIHRIRGRVYKNVGMAFTNRSLPLLADFRRTLTDLGFSPTQKTQYTVFLRREKEIKWYFNLIGSSNPKHLQKIADYFSLKREESHSGLVRRTRNAVYRKVS